MYIVLDATYCRTFGIDVSKFIQRMEILGTDQLACFPRRKDFYLAVDGVLKNPKSFMNEAVHALLDYGDCLFIFVYHHINRTNVQGAKIVKNRENKQELNDGMTFFNFSNPFFRFFGQISYMCSKLTPF